MSYSNFGAAYQWARTPNTQTFPDIPPVKPRDRSGINGAVDEFVKGALDYFHVTHYLEQVTGAPEFLVEAAKIYRAQAIELQKVGEDLRAGAIPLSENWEGDAADAFGGHMDYVVQAIDSTAEDMSQTAQILASAAKECELAEQTVIHLISELILLLAAEAATSFILDLVTFGAATVIDALVSGAEIAAYATRIARVSEELATALRELATAIKELKAAVRAGKSIKEIAGAANAARGAAKAVRTANLFGEGASAGQRLLNWGVHFGLDAGAGSLVDAVGTVNGDPVGEITSPFGGYLFNSTGQQSLLGEPVLGNGHQQAPAPYRVDRDKIEKAFG